jgi:peptidyl-prolyl cis-trans isomerase C
VVARVGNATLTRESMRQMMSWEGMVQDQDSDFVDRWVNRELLFQEAKRLEIEDREELRWQREMVEREYFIQKLLEKHFAEKIQITDEEVESYYEDNKDLFQVDEDEVRAQHIITKTEAEADRALQEIQAGKPFEAVATERSVGLFRERGGDMGYFREGDVIREVSRVAFRLGEGRVSSVFRSSHGYHILKVLKKRSRNDFKDLTEVRSDILQRLRVMKERSVYYDLLFELQNKTKIFVSVPPSEGNTRAESNVVDE